MPEGYSTVCNSSWSLEGEPKVNIGTGSSVGYKKLREVGRVSRVDVQYVAKPVQQFHPLNDFLCRWANWNFPDIRLCIHTYGSIRNYFRNVFTCNNLTSCCPSFKQLPVFPGIMIIII